MRELKTTTLINRPLETVFSFFSDASNLNLLTPDELHFQILTPMPLEMKKGARIAYRIKLLGFPFNWKTEITEWDPVHGFTDKQLSGPYRLWIHRHDFEEVDSHTTKMTDTVQYKSPGGLLEPLIHHLFVKHKVSQIFRYREQKLQELFRH